MMSKSKIFLLVSLIFLAVNFLWLVFFDDRNNNPAFIFGKFYTFEAVVVNIDKKLNGYNLLLEPTNLADFSGKILVYADLHPRYNYGDILEISAKIYKPEAIVDDSGKIFAYDKYLAKDNILATCFRPAIKIIGQNKDIFFYLSSVGDYFWNSLDIYLIEPASSLAKGILLAKRREIPNDLRSIFSQVGLSHVVAISGLHIAIIVWLMQSFLSALGLNRKKSFYILIILIFLYLSLIGFPSSAMRASFMAIIVLLGPFLGRKTDSIYSLVLAADVLVLLNPYVLVYDIGFQLSFLAVLGLLYYVKFFNKTLIFIPKVFKIREVFAVTLAAQVFTWPLIVYHFKIFSLIAPLANFLVLPLLPLVLVFSLLLSIFGFWPFLANVLSWPLFLSLKIMVIISWYLSEAPYAYLQLDDFSLIYLFISLFFIILTTIILKPKSYD